MFSQAELSYIEEACLAMAARSYTLDRPYLAEIYTKIADKCKGNKEVKTEQYKKPLQLKSTTTISTPGTQLVIDLDG